MHTSLHLFLLLSALIASVLAATVNPMSSPVNGDVLNAGQPFLVEWAVTSNHSVSLFLRKGDPVNLSSVLTIVTKLPNTGVVRWTPPEHLATGSSYTIQIQDDATGETNYSPQFTIIGKDEAATAPSPTAPNSAKDTPAKEAPAPYAANSTTPTPSVDEEESAPAASASKAPKKGGKGGSSPTPSGWNSTYNNTGNGPFANLTNSTGLNQTYNASPSTASATVLGGLTLMVTLALSYCAVMLY
ncbi:Ser-Thr-rich glycosyl-phosphatidyl-inositol-anchored membrane family-domain-containing protein [Kockiozyma suomiensis]|uniref:Ser-Thr-rich glycosyl-phosphatidyl-inositol-anchored membrane family-domain-containing protein n=1 Tax=Kockiozyma suomiensis TaxID=1337062 RepID=UPI003343D1C8